MPDSFEIQLDSSYRSDSGWRFPLSTPRLLLRCDSGTSVTTLSGPEGALRTWDDPLAALSWMEQHIRQQPGPSANRWIGYLSYDLGRLFEKLPSSAQDDLSLPLFAFGLVQREREPAIGPHSFLPGKQIGTGAIYFPSDAMFPAYIEESASCSTGKQIAPVPIYRSTFTRASYCRAVQRVIDYIAAGDVFQVNLSQRFTCISSDKPFTIYQRLQQATPAWYGGYLNFGDHALLCNSPELFLHVHPDRRVVTRPIKGTRPLKPGMDRELRDSLKDQAELNMIVDLERNDLGRVCAIGSVKVSQPRVIEAHPTVYHGVATIEGLLRDDVTLVDLLRATFPGGSVTGAPKIRAMEIIDEIEPVRRGPYCGAIGYLAPDGTIQFSIAIRTMIASGKQIYVPVGGGIVADSDPVAEYEETLVKAQAMFAALTHF